MKYIQLKKTNDFHHRASEAASPQAHFLRRPDPCPCGAGILPIRSTLLRRTASKKGNVRLPASFGYRMKFFG